MSISSCDEKQRDIPLNECRDKSLNPNDLSHDLILKIFGYLDINSIKNSTIVCKNFRKHTVDPFFWRELLERDFGKKIANLTAVERCKETYIRENSWAKDLIKYLPNSTLLATSPNAPSIMIYGKLFPQNFDSYIESLSFKQLREVVIRSAQRGFLLLLETIIEHRKFSLLSLNQLALIVYSALNVAAFTGQVEVIKRILMIPKFPKIASKIGFDHALYQAAIRGETEAMKLIMDNQFVEIDTNGEYGLFAAYVVAAEFGQIEAIKLLMKHPKFAEINPNGPFGLGQAFALAAKGGYLEVMRLIKNHPKFREVTTNDIIRSFYTSAFSMKWELIDELVRRWFRSFL